MLTTPSSAPNTPKIGAGPWHVVPQVSAQCRWTLTPHTKPSAWALLGVHRLPLVLSCNPSPLEDVGGMVPLSSSAQPFDPFLSPGIISKLFYGNIFPRRKPFPSLADTFHNNVYVHAGMDSTVFCFTS